MVTWICTITVSGRAAFSKVITCRTFVSLNSCANDPLWFNSVPGLRGKWEKLNCLLTLVFQVINSFLNSYRHYNWWEITLLCCSQFLFEIGIYDGFALLLCFCCNYKNFFATATYLNSYYYIYLPVSNRKRLKLIETKLCYCLAVVFSLEYLWILTKVVSGDGA